MIVDDSLGSRIRGGGLVLVTEDGGDHDVVDVPVPGLAVELAAGPLAKIGTFVCPSVSVRLERGKTRWSQLGC